MWLSILTHVSRALCLSSFSKGKKKKKDRVLAMILSQTAFDLRLDIAVGIPLTFSVSAIKTLLSLVRDCCICSGRWIYGFCWLQNTYRSIELSFLKLLDDTLDSLQRSCTPSTQQSFSTISGTSISHSFVCLLARTRVAPEQTVNLGNSLSQQH